MCNLKGWLAAVLTVAVLLTGCGVQNAGEFVKEKYALEDVQGNGDQKIYRAQGQKVPDVAKAIAADNKPDEMSPPNDTNMFLLYPDQVVHVQQDPKKTDDALVEVDTKEFVRQNYDPNYLGTFLTAAVMANIFGSAWRSMSGGGYHGYGDYYRSRPYPSYGGGSSGYRTPSGGSTGGYKAPSTGGSTGGTGGFTKPPRTGGGSGRVIRRK